MDKATHPRFENYPYISPKARPNGWKGDPEIKKKVAKGLDNFKFGRAWFVQNFGWDGYVKESKKVKFEDLASKDRPAKSTNFTDLGAYMAYR